MVDLKGKTVIITGASSGIGAALAMEFSRRGAHVTLAAPRLERLEEVSWKCPGEVFALAADLTREADRGRIVQQTLDRWRRIDVLVNNAGLGIYGDFLSASEEDWRRIFEVNLCALVFMTRAVLREGQRTASSAVGQIHRQPALRCLLVRPVHVEPGLAHRLDHAIERHVVLAVAVKHGEPRGSPRGKAGEDASL